VYNGKENVNRVPS